MLREISTLLTDAVLRGAVEVIRVRRSGALGMQYKDATELVTEADRASDRAIAAELGTRLAAIDPSISFHLEESGITGTPGSKRIGADPLDGTSHFAAGGNLYSIQAHYIEDGVVRAGVVFQPEAFLPLDQSENCVGRLVTAIRGEGAFMRRTDSTENGFHLSEPRLVRKKETPATRAFVACVPFSGKMSPDERAIARKVYDSGILGATTGTGGAGGNVMMCIFGGQHVYANFGAGEDLDLAPPQVIAEEAGLTVWGADRRPPVWHIRKQPFVVAPNPAVAELFLKAAGL